MELIDGVGMPLLRFGIGNIQAATQYLNEDFGDQLEEEDYVDFFKAGNLCHSLIKPPSYVGGDDDEVMKKKKLMGTWGLILYEKGCVGNWGQRFSAWVCLVNNEGGVSDM